VISPFVGESAERVWDRQHVQAIDRTVQRAALRKLELIHTAKDVEDLRIPRGNRLERLIGDRKGQLSIRVNDQWRICLCRKTEVRKISNSSAITEGDR